MASPMADDFQPPLVKRVRAESESPRKASAKAEDNIANSLNSSHHLSSMQAPFVGQSSWYAQPSSEAGTDDAADSGFSDGATPPASCEDSQESFSISAVPQAAASSSTSSSASVSGMATRSHSLSETLGDSAFVLDVEDGDEEEDDDQVSVISGLSNLSGSEWKPMAGPFSWVQRQMISGADPRALLQNMISGSSMIPEDMDQLTLWRIILNMLCDVPRRSKLDHVNTLDDVVGLIRSSKRIIVLTGAGVSVSCGIPDFRSRNGIYARLAVDFPDLPDPQAMFDIEFFKRNPKPFFKFAHEIYPGQFQPSPCHKFIRCLETHGTLLRNYTQNIDTLEQVVGLTRIVQCHGSFATATCMKCKFKVHSDDIKDSILKEKVPYCPKCVAPDISGQPDSDALHLNNSSGDLPPILKPDIVFFGESLGDEFHQSVAHDKNEADLLIMIGSSLKVRPVSLIPSSVDPKVPQVLINREPLLNISPDVELLGDCDGIINEICLRLGAGWEEPVHSRALSEISELPALPEAALAPSSEGASEASNYVRISLAKRLPDRSFYFSPPNRYIFPGAEVFEEQHQLDSDDDHIESPATDAEDDDDDDDSVIPNTDTPTGRNFTPGSAAASESS